MENEPLSEETPYAAFTLALRSPITREKYLQRLAIFMKFVGINDGNIEQRCNNFGKKARADSKWLTLNVIRYLQIHRERLEKREISAATLRNYLKPIKLFSEQIEITLPWKRLTRGLPRGRRYANDRVPTFEEIQKITAYPDRRIKPILYTMASSGIRLGAWNYLKWADVSPIIRDGNTVAARLRVYAEEDEEYYTFISLEAYKELAAWMEYRKDCGEKITGETWLMRNLWNVTKPYGIGLATIPKQLKPDGIKRLMERALWAQGVRKGLSKNRKRYEFQVNHSYRKWFKTRCELGGMKSIVIEELLSHSTGISDHYFRPNQQELENEYLKCIDYLTIDPENRLRKRVDELTEKEKDNNYIIRAKFLERDEQIRSLKEQVIALTQSNSEIKELLKHPNKIVQIANEE